MNNRSYHYGVFLSYSHADRAWARRVAEKLETWRVPSRLAGTNGAFGPVPARLGPVFRDRDELPASSDLGPTISRALDESASMVVICSPAAARSRWVNEEIRTFKSLGRGERIFAFIVAGDPAAGDGPEQCFPPALRYRVTADGELTDEPAEPAAADARDSGDGPRRALIRLMAGLMGVSYDALYQREQHRRRRRWLAIAASAVLGLSVAGTLAYNAWVAREAASRSQATSSALVDFLVSQRHPELASTDWSPAPVTLEDGTVLAPLSPDTQMTDEALEAQASALREQGMEWQRRYELDSALQAFRLEHRRRIDLVRRKREEPDQIFELAQAAFYVGENYFLQQNIGRAEDWFDAYRQTTRVLAAQNPERLDWLLEKAFGDFNVAGMQLHKGDPELAASMFADASTALEELRARGFRPDEMEIYIAGTRSFQGSCAEALGDLPSAEAYFSESARLFGEQAARKQGSEAIPVEHRQADQLVHLARVMRASGDVEGAADTYRRAAAMQGRLVASSPETSDFRRTEYTASRGLAEILASRGEFEQAARLFAGLLSEETMASLGPPGSVALRPLFANTMAAAARAGLVSGETAEALRLAGKSVELASAHAASQPADAANSALLADALLVRGQVHSALGHSADARADFQRAFDAISPFAAKSRLWLVLDPFVRAGLLLGRSEDVGAAQESLDAIGYRPLWPWPADASAVPGSSEPAGNSAGRQAATESPTSGSLRIS